MMNFVAIRQTMMQKLFEFMYRMLEMKKLIQKLSHCILFYEENKNIFVDILWNVDQVCKTSFKLLYFITSVELGYKG